MATNAAVASASAGRSNHGSAGVYSSGVYFFAGSVQEYKEAKWVDFYMMMPPTVGIFFAFALVFLLLIKMNR